MHTSASIAIDGDTAVLSKGGKKIKVQVSSNAMDFELLSMDAKPLPTSPSVPDQNANDGYRKLAVKMNSDSYTTLTVRISPYDDKGQVDTTPIDMWSLGGNDDNTSVTLVNATDHSSLSAYADAEYENNYGEGGKLPEDENIKFAGVDKCISAQVDKSLYKKYVVVSANVMTDDVASKVCITNGSKPASDYPVLNLNQWNNIKLVIDTSTGKAYTEVNGNMGSRYDFTCEDNKFGIGVSGNGDKNIYIDDFKIETSDNLETTVYPSLEKVFDINDGYIKLQEGLTAEYIARRSEIQEVTAYADETLAQQLPDDAQLTEGNAVVVRNGEYSVTYVIGEITVSDGPDIKWIASSSDNFGGSFNVQRAIAATAYGVCGKNTSDGVWQLRYDPAGSTAGETDIYMHHSLNAEQAAGVVTFEFDVYFTDSIRSFKFATGSHITISNEIKSSVLNINSWNRIRYVYDGSAKTAKLYINDVIRENRSDVNLRSNSLRFLAYTSKGTDSVYYLDNINLYMGKLAQHPVTSTAYEISSSSITVPAGADIYDVVNDLKKRFDIYDIWVYNKNGVVALNRDVVEEGMTLVVCDGNNVLRQYSLK